MAKFNMRVVDYLDMKYDKSNAEIAEVKGISEATLYNWIKSNKAEIDRLTQKEKAETQDKYQNVMQQIKDQRERINNLVEDNKQLTNELEEKDKVLKELTLEKERLYEINDGFSNDDYQQKYEHEKQKHDALFAYLQVIQWHPANH